MSEAKVLYIKKKGKTRSWSNVLDRQFSALNELSNGDVLLYEISTASLINYIKEPFRIYKFIRSKEIKILYVNHIICAYPLILILPFLRSVKKILALHESEPVLGVKFLFKNINKLPFKEWVRYTVIMKIPVYFFDKILVLNERQINFTGIKRERFKQLNFLGIKTHSGSLTESKKADVHVFFPHNINRVEKGYNLYKEAVENISSSNRFIKFIVGGGFTHEEMMDQYKKADVVVLCGYYETYSLVFLEAISFNKKVVINKNLGIVQNLLKEVDERYLVSKGLYIADHSIESIQGQITKAINDIDKPTNSKQILSDFNLNESEVNKKLWQFIKNVDEGRK